MAATSPAPPNKLDVTDEILSLAVKATPYVLRNEDGTFTLTATASDLNVSKEAFNRFADALEGINNGIRQGDLMSDSQGNIALANKGVMTEGSGMQGVLPCVTYSVRLTEAQTVKVEAMLNMIAAGAAGVAGLAAFFATVAPPSVPVAALTGLATGIVAAGAWFFASWMAYVDNGKGDTIVWGLCAVGIIVPTVYPVGN